MLNVVLSAVLLCVGLSFLLCCYRFFKGPAFVDRILALDTLSLHAIALIILLGVFMGTPLYFEVALLMALLGFISTSALCKYLLRGDIIE